jgi:hypothetical protein
MHRSRHAVVVTAATLAALTTGACSSSSSTDEEARAQQEAAAAASSAATAPPGVYGTTIDPSRPDPTNVATDAPVTAPTGRAVPVFVTHSGWNATTEAIEIAGSVDLLEDGGTCTLTVTQGDKEVTASRPATEDASTTSCGWLTVAGPDVDRGVWTAVLDYRSATSRATSEPVTVEVP